MQRIKHGKIAEVVKSFADESGFKELVSPEVIPADRDWHLIITATQAEIWGSDGKAHLFMTFHHEVGYYNGYYWTLGNKSPADPDKTRPDSPVVIYGYEKAVRMKSSLGKFAEDEAGLMALSEAMLEDARKEYITAYRRYLHHPDSKDAIADLKMAEHGIPMNLLPGASLDEVLHELQRQARKGMRGLKHV